MVRRSITFGDCWSEASEFSTMPGKCRRLYHVVWVMVSPDSTFDFICNHIGNEVWTHRMEWTGQAGFVEAKWQDWEVDGKVAGSFKTYGKLSVSSTVTCRRKQILIGSCSRSSTQATWCRLTSQKRHCKC